MSDTDSSYSITELAREFDITTRTIRFYEDRGLLAPQRRGSQRVYSRADRTRLKLVLRGKRLGWALDEIRDMIELYDEPGGEARQLDLMLSRIEQSRATLLEQQQAIELALAEFDDIEQRCLERRGRLGNPANVAHPGISKTIPAPPLESPGRDRYLMSMAHLASSPADEP